MDKDYEYHKKQFSEIKRSTVIFVDWLKSIIDVQNSVVLDLACGAGANTEYLGGVFRNSKFIGIDCDKRAIELYQGNLSNVRLEQGDWYNLSKKYINYFDGVVSFQTLSWLSDYKEPLEKICELNPRWIALTSLYYEGKINYYIRVDDQEKHIQGWEKDGGFYYNIYSLPIIKEFFIAHGYTRFEYKKFEIDIDIPKPKSVGMGTYTLKILDGERLQISGALLMPWYFVFAGK